MLSFRNSNCFHLTVLANEGESRESAHGGAWRLKVTPSDSLAGARLALALAFVLASASAFAWALDSAPALAPYWIAPRLAQFIVSFVARARLPVKPEAIQKIGSRLSSRRRHFAPLARSLLLRLRSHSRSRSDGIERRRRRRLSDLSSSSSASRSPRRAPSGPRGAATWSRGASEDRRSRQIRHGGKACLSCCCCCCCGCACCCCCCCGFSSRRPPRDERRR